MRIGIDCDGVLRDFIGAFRKVVAQEFPNQEIYYKNIADSYYVLQNYTQAKIYYMEVLSYNEENPENARL